MRGFSRSGSRTASTPRTRTSPRSGSRRPSRTSTVVVLPAPLGPSRPKIVPAWTSKLTPSTARVSPYALCSPATRMTGSAAAAVGLLTWPMVPCRLLRSEPLAEVGRHGGVVAELLVQALGVRTVMAGGDLGERRADLAAQALRLLHQQPADAALADAGVDHERHDADDPVRMLEAREGMDSDEPEHLAVVVRDQDARVLGVEAPEALDDVARPRGVALIGEQRRDRLGVGGRRRADDDRRMVGHRPDGSERRSTTIRCGPLTGPSRTRTDGPNGPIATPLMPTPAAAARRRKASRPSSSGTPTYRPAGPSP